MNLIKSTLLFLFIFIFSSCENKSRIPEDTMVKIYTDFLVVQDTTLFASLDLDSLQHSVFTKYNVSAEMYESTFDYYNEDSKRWEQFFDKVIAYIDTSFTRHSPNSK